MSDFLFRNSERSRVEIPEGTFFEDDKIPGKISIFFNIKNFEMKKIDQAIKHRYKVLKKKVSENYERIEKLKKELSKTAEAGKFCIQEKISEEKKLINDYENDLTLNEYISRSRDIIKEFCGEKNLEEDRRITLIDNFLDIASEYIEIEVIRQTKKEYKCRNCGQNLEGSAEELEGSYVCPECSYLNPYMAQNTYIRDVEKLPSSTDDEISNFVKVLDKFEGKYTPYPPIEIYEKLDEYFRIIGFSSGEEIRKLPLDERGKKHGTNKKMLWTALESIGFNNHYDESNYIAYKYWGWTLPDISKLREQIIDDYQKTQKVWQTINHLYDRKASLGTQYRLYGHLRSVGYPVEREDFRIQESVESLRIHNDAWEKMCKGAKIKCFIVN